MNHLCILILGVTVFYFFLDLAYQTHVEPVIFISMLLCGSGTYLLNRFQYYSVARYFGLVSFNFLIYAVASSESSETGIFLYFGVAGLSSLILFGYEERIKSYGFAALSALLYILSQQYTFSPLAERNFTPDQVQVFFIINVVVCSYVAAFILLQLMRVNFKTEETLRQSNVASEKQNADLAKTNLELDRFVYSASHDLRAPLNSILGLIEICELSNDPEEIRQCHALMRRSIKNMDEFTKEIINYSRNSRQELKEEPVVLFDLVVEVVEDLQFTTGAEEIYIKYNIDKELCITVDKARLRAVLNNLVGNSIKYHDPNKEDQFISIEAEYEQPTLTLKVSDNGLGIPEEHQAKIFEMFYRATDTSKGSGLGLYIVKEIVQKLRGQIEVASEYRKGSTFTVAFPVQVMASEPLTV